MSQGSVWFITGTTSGLGNALLHQLLSTGNRVVATTRNPEPLQAELNGKYDAEALDRVLVLKLDITKEADVQSGFAVAIRKFGRVDVVVNNAGYAVLAEVEACPVEDGRKQFEVMFWAPVLICKEAVRIFREVNPAGAGGLIFNVSSCGGYSAQAGLSYYNAAKFALEGFTEAIRKEMSPEWKIQATIIEPGGFTTEWRGANMSILPSHPAYTSPSNPTAQFRSVMDSLPFIGSPERAAKAFVALAQKKDELPLRIQLGSDSLAIVRYTASKAIADGEKWQDVSHSTNVDGIHPQEYTKNLLAALGSH